MTHTCKISKQEVWQAYKQVLKNRGGGGVDGVTLERFGEDLENNLYKIWNRMSSGSYFPPEVRRVEIPKAGGKVRQLGIPTVGDRIAQTVIKNRLEPDLEQQFHEDSYGYRPKRGAREAIGTAMKRCWRYNWVVDMDIKGFFDNIDHRLMMKAVDKHVEERWMKVYIKRWLEAAVVSAEGARETRTEGTPQGGVISPLLANLYLHYVFDLWMKKNLKHIKFERYADDIILHCRTKGEAKTILETISERFKACKLTLHPEKTSIVTWKKRKSQLGNEEHPAAFDYLGYQFKPRKAISKGKLFVNISPAISPKAKKKIKEVIKSWRIPKKTTCTIEQMAKEYNPTIRGWYQYYGMYGKSELKTVTYWLDSELIKWMENKHMSKKMGKHQVWRKLQAIKKTHHKLFAHW